ncbi:peptide ABC transporter substrate-binding protein [Marinitenerispora sediminis]|uniref:Peptide ABC transporter substrate-binding protein n=2 Tax=Marinitenerispora sediminis TaxID=1931232 RepID=A0A368T9W3_9ACTN|nr:peptide ABC transporter substrate-binding protein [Marinitenerispora sediminis]RCV59867.1 peptide ABC transporter substrate-binding protein [Marinitenerispora sediminis]RCV61193.1 peptide ABC transporter substrate-binding protein [Marinitenerispora sediminis]
MMDTLLTVEGLTKHFPVRGGWGRTGAPVRAVDGVDLTAGRGETLGIVGESGCGKSTTGRAILRLIEPTAGTVRVDGTDLAGLGPAELRRFRRRMQLVFQDPYASLDPRWTVERTLTEVLRTHTDLGRDAVRERIGDILETVGLSAHHRSRYPHEFSGGQRQRISIARALLLNPDLVVADEPVSALDVSVQAQVINLMKDLQQEFGMTYLFISHDLSVVRFISDRVAVMYLGRVVELADTADLFADPKHPYTRALLSALPVPDPAARRERVVLTGDLPSPSDPPAGCAFHTRCPLATERCRVERPETRVLAGESGPREVACHLAE